MKRRTFLEYTGAGLFLANTLTMKSAHAGTFASLQGAYEQGFAQQLPFSGVSYYVSPWRAYMDTWPSNKFQDVLGLNFSISSQQGAAATIQAVAEAGIRTLRCEVSWSAFRYAQPTQLLSNQKSYWQTVFQACKTYGIRPLILLNGNSGLPCPARYFSATLTSTASAGARQISISPNLSFPVDYTGLSSVGGSVACSPIITAYQPTTGLCTLSAPLPVALSAGPITLVTLKYQPFSGFVFKDGTANPAGQETLDGWVSYVVAICQFASGILGTSTDAGFDLEVWNELTFGSEFLYDANYYNPPRQYSQLLQYSNPSLTWKEDTAQVLIALTVDAVNGQYPGTSTVFPKINVISGAASNTTPWTRGTDMWPGQAGYSRHYYSGLNSGAYYSPETGTQNNGSLTQATAPPETSARTLNALYQVDPAPSFVPTHTVNMPELWYFGYLGECITRDLQPYPSEFNNYEGYTPYYHYHHRYSHTGDGQIAQVWMTETNTTRTNWSQPLIANLGIAPNDPNLIALMHAVAAKATLRQYLFFAHKGIKKIALFSIEDSDLNLAVLPSAFFTTLAANNYQLNDTVRAQLGPQLTAIKRLVPLLKQQQTIDSPRKLKVSSLVEYSPHLVFAGDGTTEHPNLYHRDDFACLPFQLSSNSFAIGYYVVTRNMIQEWQTNYGNLDPRRYNMPEQTFDLTLQNIRGTQARIKVYDPIQHKTTIPTIVASTASSITLRVLATDYPRLILLTEGVAGPQLIGPKVSRNSAGVSVSFSVNISGKVKMSWGALPRRNRQSQTITVIAGQSYSLNIATASLESGDGISLKLTSTDNALWVNWPMWGYDVQGLVAYAT
jgi:hypothetical protein